MFSNKIGQSSRPVNSDTPTTTSFCLSLAD